MPRISIIMPAYNCEQYIAQAVESVQQQRYTDWELIIIDDGSTDGTARVVSRFAETDSRVRLIRAEHVGKPSVARNSGLEKANGEFVSFLDADDYYSPQKCERQIACFSRFPVADVVFSDMAIVVDGESDPKEEAVLSYLSGSSFLERASPLIEAQEGQFLLLSSGFYRFMSVEIPAVSTQTVMIRRKALETQGIWFDVDMLVGEDVDLWLRLAQNARVALVNEVLSFYRRRGGSLTRNAEKFCEGAIAYRVKNLQRARTLLSREERSRCRQKIAGLWFDLGYIYYRQRRWRDAIGAFRKSARYRPSGRAFTAGIKAVLGAMWVHRGYKVCG